MGFASTEDSVMDDADCGGVKSSSCGSVPCSICLEIVADNSDRSWAKLQCGHQFHLDCIGSAFNAKGAMQCPNCRKIEKGQWLYTNGSRSYPEFSIWDDWNHDEDHYDASYSEMSFGVHWCPFGQLARFPSVFEDGEFSSSTYHDMLGQPAILTEHAAVPAATHPCPYFAFFGPVHPSTNSNGSAPDSSNFSSHWNGPTIANEMPTSYAFPMDVNYHGWEHHCPSYLTSSSNVGAADQHPVPPIPQASVWATSDMSRSGPYVQPPVVGQSSGRRAGSSVASSMVPPYPGSNARNRDRVQALQAYYQQQATDSPAIQNPTVSHTRRSNGHRGVAQMGSVSSTDQSGGFFVFQSTPGRSFLEGEIPLSTRLAWDRDLLPSSTFSSNQVDRDPNWGSFHQSLPLPNPDTRYTSYTGFRQRHGP